MYNNHPRSNAISINPLVNVFAATLTFYLVFRVNDLMYFVITACGTTLLDVLASAVTQKRPMMVT